MVFRTLRRHLPDSLPDGQRHASVLHLEQHLQTIYRGRDGATDRPCQPCTAHSGTIDLKHRGLRRQLPHVGVHLHRQRSSKGPTQASDRSPLSLRHACRIDAMPACDLVEEVTPEQGVVSSLTTHQMPRF